MKIVFATHNNNKLNEVESLLSKHVELLSLKDIGCTEDIAETAATLKGNAQLKADYITETYGYDCFADDTGLEVDALDGAPGVYSARYSGEPSNAEANIQRVLKNLKAESNRSARFVTVIALNLKGKQYFFQGTCPGDILKDPQGVQGFGYDPIFKPEGYGTSFAQMSSKEKGLISHRGKAVAKLVKFLSSVNLEL